MTDANPEALISVAPNGRLPEWPLSWANIWIDQLGGTHWTRYTHGTTFEDIFAKVYGRGVDRDENNWMFDVTGSAGDTDDDGDNPGWQFNELAVRQLGWVRVKASRLDGLDPEFTVRFDELASEQAIKATIRLLRAQPKSAKVELGACEEFGDEIPLGKAISELREWAAEAPQGEAAAPTYLPKPRRRF